MAKVVAAKAALPSEVKKYSVEVAFLTPLLGTAPENPALYGDFIIGKALDERLKKAKTEEDKEAVEQIRKAMLDREISMLPGNANSELLESQEKSVQDVLKEAAEEGAEVVKGRTVFRRLKGQGGGPGMLGYQWRGYLKEAAVTHSDIPQPESKIDKFCWIGEIGIPILRNGKPLRDVDGEFSRPLRTKDQRTGVSRVCIATSEFINPFPVTGCKFTVFVMPKGFSTAYSGGKFSADDVKHWLEAGAFNGTGQFRSGGHGCFKIVSFVEEDVDWKDALKARLKMLEDGVQLY